MLPPFLLLPFFRSSCCCSLFICCPSVLSSSSPRVHPHRPQGEEQTSGKFWRKKENQELRKYLKVNQESRLPHWKLKSEPTWASPGYLGSVLSLEDVYQLLPGEDYNKILPGIMWNIRSTWMYPMIKNGPRNTRKIYHLNRFLNSGSVRWHFGCWSQTMLYRAILSIITINQL